MARDRANIWVDIWSDQDWRGVSAGAQHLYFQLLTHGQLSYAGVLDWHPGRLAAMVKNRTKDQVIEDAAELEAGGYIVIDLDTDEVLIRSYIKHDGLMKQPKLVVSMTNGYSAIASSKIREVIAFEVQKLRDREQTLAAWKVKQVQTVLAVSGKHWAEFGPALTPAVTPEPSPTVTPDVTLGFPPNAAQAQGLPTTTATTTSTKTFVQPLVGTSVQALPKKKSTDYSTAFEEWWVNYPKRQAKGDAWKAWEQLRKESVLPTIDVLIAKSRAYAKTKEDPQFLRLPAGWLRGTCWLDEDTDTLATPSAWDGKEMFGGPDA